MSWILQECMQYDTAAVRQHVSIQRRKSTVEPEQTIADKV